MTGDDRMWIRVDVGVGTHKKTQRILRAHPELTRAELVGLLVALWTHTRMQQPDGVLVDYDVDDIAAAIGSTPEVVASLIEHRYIDATPSGYVVHEWMEHNGEHMKEAKKKRDQRARTKAVEVVGELFEAARPASSIRPVLSRPVASRREDVPGPSPGHAGDALALVRGIAKGMRVPRPGEVDRDAIADAAKRAGCTAQETKHAMQLGAWVGKRIGPTLAVLFAEHWIEHRATIGNAWAYYNPGAPGCEAIKARLAGDHATEQLEAIKHAERRWLAGGGR